VAEARTTDERTSQRGRLFRILRIVGAALALGLLVALVWHLGPRALAGQVLAAGPGFLWILLLHGLAIAISALPWHVLLPRHARPTIPQTIASRFVAAGANAVTPVVAFAGDLVRLFWLPHKADRPHGVAAVIVDRLMYGAANAVFVLAGGVALVHAAGLPPQYTRLTTIVVIVLVALVAIGMVLVAKYRLVGRIHHLISRIRRKERDHQFGDDVDASIENMLRRKPVALALAFSFNVLFRVAITLQIYVAFRLLGVSLSWIETLLFGALPIVMAVAGFLVPSQLGVQEGAQALLAQSFGIPTTTAVAVVLLLRIRSLVGGALVAILIATKRSTLEEARAAAHAGDTPAAPATT
jgi:glycosyltransferase 2 family protein